jgi:hypothetical protein
MECPAMPLVCEPCKNWVVNSIRVFLHKPYLQNNIKTIIIHPTEKPNEYELFTTLLIINKNLYQGI